MSRRPKSSRFWQQELPAWKPLQTPASVSICLLVFGVVYLPIGIALFAASNSVVEVSQRYDNLCMNCTSPAVIDQFKRNFWNGSTIQTNKSFDFYICQAYSFNDTLIQVAAEQYPCITTVDIVIPEDMKAPVYVYYMLTNFYSNNRIYVKSRSDKQLTGQDPTDTSNCDEGSDVGANASVYYPCGHIAASFFNDTFSACLCTFGNSSCFMQANQTANQTLPTSSPQTPQSNQTFCPYVSISDENQGWDKSTIYWPTDSKKFVNVSNSRVTKVARTGITLPDLDDPDFMVWMRTSAFPDFKKLYRVIHQDLHQNQVLRFSINNRFQTASFKGTKTIVLSTTSWFGGKSSFIGIAYIIFAVVSIFLSAVFMAKHSLQPRVFGDMKYFLWPGQSRPIR